MSKRKFQRYFSENIVVSVDGFDTDVIDISFGGISLDDKLNLILNSMYDVHIKVFKKHHKKYTMINSFIVTAVTVRKFDNNVALKFCNWNIDIFKLIFSFIINKWKTKIYWNLLDVYIGWTGEK